MEVAGGAVINVVALAEVKEEAQGEDIRTTEEALLREAAHDNGSNQTFTCRQTPRMRRIWPVAPM